MYRLLTIGAMAGRFCYLGSLVVQPLTKEVHDDMMQKIENDRDDENTMLGVPQGRIAQLQEAGT
jgi:hypothetical protein